MKPCNRIRRMSKREKLVLLGEETQSQNHMDMTYRE